MGTPRSYLPGSDGSVPFRPASAVSVRGGAAGIEVYEHDLVRIAAALDRAAHDAAHSGVALQAVVVDLGDASSAVLDPVGWARFEAQLLPALNGPHGTMALAARSAVLDRLLRVAAQLYRTCDDVSVYLRPLMAALTDLPAANLAVLHAVLTDPTHPQRWLDEMLGADPALAPVLVGAIAAGLPSVAAGVVGAGIYLTRLKVVARPGTAARVVKPPRDVEQLIQGLSDADSGSRGDGAVIVRFLYFADGSRRVVVDIRGMDGLTSPVTGVAPATNSLVGRESAYQRGVIQAMTAAGVRASDDVMLVGHSEGGMVGVNLAADPDVGFHITHVITAGSPIGQTSGSVPSNVQVLAVENHGDFVPDLDGRLNPAAPNITTVTVNHADASAGDNHDLDAYEQGGHDIDASGAPSIVAFQTSMAGYLSAISMVSKTYAVTPSN